MADDNAESDELRQFKAWFKADRDHSAKWRKEAEEDFAFLAGEQWTEAEKRALKEQMRPIITFNRTHPIINSISGMEISNRQEVKYFPREEGDAKADEILTEGAIWFRDQADADDTDSDAFLNAAVCGMGWTETTLDMEEDEEGAPTMEPPTPLEMYWDKGATRKNLADAERIWRVRKKPRAWVLDKFPDADPDEIDARWAQADVGNDSDESQEEAKRYQDTDGPDFERDQSDVTIVHLQYKKRGPYYLVADPMTGQQSEIPTKELAKLKERYAALGIKLAVTKKTRMVVRNVFIGSDLLQKETDALCKKHFSFQCITAYKDHKSGLFYGLMRLMKDPQRWANKWMSQALHILNSNAKGGLMVEKGAVGEGATAIRDFERDWARPDKIQWLESGGLNMVKEKQAIAMPAGFFQMMEFAIQSVRDVTGISVELLGMREANQAASLEYQRKQAGMTIIAPLFDNLKRYRRDHGKLMLYIIQNYLADGRLVRIVGEEGAKYVPLALKADATYDIIIDDQPNSPDQKMKVWEKLAPLLKTLPPAVQLALVDYAPLPTSVIEKIKEAAKAMQAQPQVNPEEIKAKVAMEGQHLKAENDRLANEAKAANDKFATLIDAISRIEVAQISAGVDTNSQQVEAELQGQLGIGEMINEHLLQSKDHAHQRMMQAEQPQPQAA